MTASDNMKTLYHGSSHIVEKPEFGAGKADNDFGRGFYTTEDKETAEEWATVNTSGITAVCNTYQIDVTGMNIIDLGDYSVLAWIAEAVYNRGARDNIAGIIGQMIADEYRVDTTDADIIIGYRADDSYTTNIIEAFLSNLISAQEADSLLKNGKTARQVVIKSNEAFSRLRFVSCEEVAAEKKLCDMCAKRDMQHRQKISELITKRTSEIILDGFDVSSNGIIARDCIDKNKLNGRV